MLVVTVCLESLNRIGVQIQVWLRCVEPLYSAAEGIRVKAYSATLMANTHCVPRMVLTFSQLLSKSLSPWGSNAANNVEEKGHRKVDSRVVMRKR